MEVWMRTTNRDLFWGENVIQKAMMFITGVIASFLGGILCYFLILFVVQLFKLFFCTYKKVNIHFRIFDIIIKLGQKKLFTSEDMDYLPLLKRREKTQEKIWILQIGMHSKHHMKNRGLLI